MSEPDLTQFDFTLEEIRAAAVENRLLSMEIEFSRYCNYRCPYCYAVESLPIRDEMTPEEIRSALEQAAELGAKKIVILGGEPLLYRGLGEMLDFIHSLGMAIEIFTNGSLIQETLAKELHRRNCRVVLKLNTFNPKIHDDLTGVPNSLQIARDAIRILQDAGYRHSPGLLCASTVLSAINVDEAPDMWLHLREQGILPYFECITPQGRMNEHLELLPSPERLRDTFDRIAAIDKSFGHHWEPQPPLVGSKCFRHIYSCVVKSNGTVIPCVGLDVPIGNIRKTSLREILSESRIIQQLKEHKKTIKGPCAACEKIDHCYGCRGTAYQMTGDYLASDPTCWRNTDKRHQITTLPCDVREMLPHDQPMRFVETILSVGEKIAETQSVVRPDNPFLNDDGILRPEALVEFAAQSAAALDGFEFNGAKSNGLLIEIVNFSFLGTARKDDVIRVCLHRDYDLDIWHGLSFQLFANDSLAAEGTLKVCIFER